MAERDSQEIRKVSSHRLGRHGVKAATPDDDSYKRWLLNVSPCSAMIAADLEVSPPTTES